MAKTKNTFTISSNNISKKNDQPVNKYYLTVADRYMRAKYVAVLLLVVFFAFMMINFSEDISYSNLMYLIRDFNMEDGSTDHSYVSVNYDEQENMTFDLFKGELVVAGNRTLKMYNTRGNESRTYEPAYSDPVLVSSNKYLLAYNVGGTHYSLYTSIARVNQGTTEGEIETADINNKGEYLIVSRSKDAKYLVSTYDSSFRPIAEYYKTKYITSASIGDDGRVVMCSFSSDGAAFGCTVELYYEGSEKPNSEYNASGVFPLKCGVWDNGGYYVICTDRVLFFDKKGELLKSSESVIEYNAYSASENALAISYDNDSLGTTSTVVLFDSNGEILYNKVVVGSASSLSVSKEKVFAMAGFTVYSLDIKNDAVEMRNLEKVGTYVISSGDSCIVCRKDGAEGIDFSDDAVADTAAVTSSAAK